MDFDGSVMTIVERGEGMCAVLEAEIRVINDDLSHSEACVRRYGGEPFLTACRYLLELRESKRQEYLSIVEQLSSLRKDYQSSQTLAQRLQNQSATAKR